MADEETATVRADQRFERNRQANRAASPNALLDRLERQAETIGQLNERIRALETALERAREANRAADDRLKKERAASKRQLEAQAELEKRVQSIHDNAEELARERRTVATLQAELGRAWSEVRTLQSAQTSRRGILRRSGD